MKHFCPKCKKVVSAVSLGKSFLVVGSKSIIMAGDKTTCGATFLPQQNLVVRDAGSGSGGGSSTSSSSPIFESTSQNDMVESFAKTPKKPLTEDEKILTSEECRSIAYILWGKEEIQANGEASSHKSVMKAPELSLEVRKEMTRIYFSAVDKDDGMSYIESILGSFGGVTSKAAALVIEKTIIKDIAEMKAKEKFLSLWHNEARQKYFKVGSSDNPVDKFQGLHSTVL